MKKVGLLQEAVRNGQGVRQRSRVEPRGDPYEKGVLGTAQNLCHRWGARGGTDQRTVPGLETLKTEFADGC